MVGFGGYRDLFVEDAALSEKYTKGESSVMSRGRASSRSRGVSITSTERAQTPHCLPRAYFGLTLSCVRICRNRPLLAQRARTMRVKDGKCER